MAFFFPSMSKFGKIIDRQCCFQIKKKKLCAVLHNLGPQTHVKSFHLRQFAQSIWFPLPLVP